MDVCAIFGDCGGGGDPGLPVGRTLNLSLNSSICEKRTTLPHLVCVWTDPSDSTCLIARSADNLLKVPEDLAGRCTNGSKLGPQIIVDIATNMERIYSCQLTITANAACNTVEDLHDGISIMTGPVASPPSDPPPS